MHADDLLEVSLSNEERLLLRWGLIEWGGPARCTDEFARAMGFADVRNLFEEGDRLVNAIDAGTALTRFDWCRVLLATEVVFISNLVGSGLDWNITTGLSDQSSVEILRSLQARLTRELRPVLGNGIGTRPPSRLE